MKTRNVLEGAPTDHLMRLLVGEIHGSFERMQRQLAAQSEKGEPQPGATSEKELESLVRQARLEQVETGSAKRRKRP